MSSQKTDLPAADGEPLRRKGDRRVQDQTVATERRKGDRRDLPGVGALFKTLFGRHNNGSGS